MLHLSVGSTVMVTVTSKNNKTSKNGTFILILIPQLLIDLIFFNYF